MQQLYGVLFLLVTLHPSSSSAAVFTSGYFAENVRSLSICSLFLLWYALPFILV